MDKFLVLLSVVVYVECSGLLSANSGYDGSLSYAKLYQQQPQVYQAQPQVYKAQPQVYQAQPQIYKAQTQPQIVQVQNEDDVPIKVIFRARSPKIQVEQINEPGERPSIQTSRTDEEPHRVMHEVHRPVIQEIREIIQPYRRVVQEIQPVIEQVQTIVARGDGRASNGQGGEGLVLAQPAQLDNNEYLGNGRLLTSDLSKLATLGYQASQSPLWTNAKALSRSKAAASS